MDRIRNRNPKGKVKKPRAQAGQATTEYILMLSIVVGFVLLLITQFIRPVMTRVTSNLNQYLNQTLFGANLHQIRIRN